MAARKNGVRYIFTAYVTRPDGTRDYAKNHGLRAFCMDEQSPLGFCSDSANKNKKGHDSKTA